MNLKAGPVVSLSNLYNPGSGYSAAPTVTIAAPPCVINTTTCVRATATADIDTDSNSPTFRQVTGLTLVTGGNGYNSDPSVSIAGNAQAQASLALGTALAACSNGAAACYPPAVNYTPLVLPGQRRSHSTRRSFGLALGGLPPPAAGGGNVLVRLVNAGLRMHVPSIVGSQTGLTFRRVACRILTDRRRRQRAARRAASAERSIHGRGQDLRRDDQRADRRDGPADLRPRVEPVRQCDCARRRHAGLHQHQCGGASRRAAALQPRQGRRGSYNHTSSAGQHP